MNKHGVDFSLASCFKWSEAKVIEDDRLDYGEYRFVAHGLMGVRLYAMAFTLRGEAVRIISLRKSNKREVKPMNAQHKRIMLDGEEAAINAGIATDFDNPE